MANQVRIQVNIDNRSVGNGINAINADFSRLISQVDNANASVSRANTSINRMGMSMGSLARHTLHVVGAIAGLRTIETLAVEARDSIVGFDTAMTRAASLTSLTSKEIAEFKKELKDFSTTLPIGARELGDSLYYVASAGLEASQVLPTVKASAQAAAMGMGTAGEIGSMLTSVLVAYEKDQLSATAAMDMFTKAIVLGKGEAADYAKSLGRVLPVMSNIKVGFAEIMASMASMTNLGLKPDEAATALRGIANAALNPAEQTRKALLEIGMTPIDVRRMIESSGLSQTIIEIFRRAGGSGERMNELLGDIIPNIRALNGAFVLAGQGAEAHAEMLDEVTNSMGAFAKANEIAATGVAYQMGILKTNLEAVGIGMGERLLPHAIKLADELVRRLGPSIEDAGISADEADDKFSKLGGSIDQVNKAMDLLRGQGEVGDKENIFDHLKNSANDLAEFLKSNPEFKILFALAGAGVIGGGVAGAGALGSGVGIAGAAGSGAIGLLGGIPTGADANFTRGVFGAGTNTPVAGGALGNASKVLGPIGLAIALEQSTERLIDSFGILKDVILAIFGNRDSQNNVEAANRRRAEESNNSWLGQATGFFNDRLGENLNNARNAFGSAITDAWNQARSTESRGYIGPPTVEPLSGETPRDVGKREDYLPQIKEWEERKQAVRDSIAKGMEQLRKDAEAEGQKTKLSMSEMWREALATAEAKELLGKEGQAIGLAVDQLFASPFEDAINTFINSIADNTIKLNEKWIRAFDPDVAVTKIQEYGAAVVSAIAAQAEMQKRINEGEDPQSVIDSLQHRINAPTALIAQNSLEIKAKEDADRRKREARQRQQEAEAERRRERNRAIVGFDEGIAQNRANYDERFKEIGGGGAASAAERLLGEEGDVNDVGQRISTELTKVAKELRDAKVPEWEAMYEEIVGSFRVAAQSRTPEAVQAAIAMLDQANAAIRARKELTVDSFREAFSETAIGDALGSAGAQVMRDLSRAIEENTPELTQGIVGGMSKLGKDMQKAFSPEEARARFAEVMDAINRVINEKSEESKESLRSIFKDLNIDVPLAKITKQFDDAWTNATKSFNDTMENLLENMSERVFDKAKFASAVGVDVSALSPGASQRERREDLAKAEKDALRAIEEEDNKRTQAARNRMREDRDLKTAREREDLTDIQKKQADLLKGGIRLDKYQAMSTEDRAKALDALNEANRMAGLDQAERDRQKAQKRKWDDEDRAQKRKDMDEDIAMAEDRERRIQAIRDEYDQRKRDLEDKISEEHYNKMAKRAEEQLSDAYDKITKALVESVQDIIPIADMMFDGANEGMDNLLNKLSVFISEIAGAEAGAALMDKVAPMLGSGREATEEEPSGEDQTDDSYTSPISTSGPALGSGVGMSKFGRGSRITDEVPIAEAPAGTYASNYSGASNYQTYSSSSNVASTLAASGTAYNPSMSRASINGVAQAASVYGGVAQQMATRPGEATGNNWNPASVYGNLPGYTPPTGTRLESVDASSLGSKGGIMIRNEIHIHGPLVGGQNGLREFAKIMADQMRDELMSILKSSGGVS